MKKYTHLLIASLFLLIAFSASACITEECGREGLTVYTNVPDGPNYTSVCAGGFWTDTPLDLSDTRFLKVISDYQNCQAVGCYKNGVEDCECLDVRYDR